MSFIELIERFKGQAFSQNFELHQFKGETTLAIAKDALLDTLNFFKENGFDFLIDLSAVDFLEPKKESEIFYWLLKSATQERLRITIRVAREEKVPSVTAIWAGADWYERELFDMFGIHFIDHPDLKRILMPDDWRGHPMRRDYPLTEEPIEFKNDVKPKIPSEIIPYVKIPLYGQSNFA